MPLERLKKKKKNVTLTVKLTLTGLKSKVSE